MEYYDMPWYALPVSMQKQVLCGIQHAQNGATLTMGPLGDLDFEMASDVCKCANDSIYGFLDFQKTKISDFQFTRYIYKFTMILNTMFK